MNTEMIDQLVSDGALKSLDTLNTKLASSYTEMEKLLTKVQVLSNELTKPAKAYTELSKLTEQQKNLEQNLAKAIADHAKVEKEMDELKKNVIQTNSKQVESMRNVTQSYADNSKAIVENGKTLKDISEEAYGMASKNIGNNRKNLVVLQIELKSYQEQLRKLDDQYSKNLITENTYINKKAELISKEQSQKATVKTLADSIKYENQILSTAIGTYNNASAQYSRLKIQINQMSDAEKYNGHTKAELEAQAKSLYVEMSRLQKATGKHQLDVAQYDKAVADLTKTLSILDPSIGTIITKVQSLTPLKKAWIKTNDKLVSSLKITARTATMLQLAMVGLVIGGIYLAIKAIKEWIEEQDKAAKINTEITKKISGSNYGNQIVSLKKLQTAWQELGSDLEKKKQFIIDNKKEFENLGASVVDVRSAENLLEKNTDAFIRSLQKRAEAIAAQELAAEAYGKYLKKLKEAQDEVTKGPSPSHGDNVKAGVISFLISSNKNNLSENNSPTAEDVHSDRIKNLENEAKALKATGDAYFDLGQEADAAAKKLREDAGIVEPDKKASAKLDDLQKRRKKFFDEENKLSKENAAFAIRVEADKQKDIASSNIESFDTRLKALNSYSEELKKSIETSRKDQIAEVEKQIKELGLKEEDGTEHIKMINEKAAAEILKIDRETNKSRISIMKEFESDVIKNIQGEINERIADANKKMQQELIIAAEAYRTAMKTANSDKERNKITKDYQEQRIKIIHQYNQQALQEEIKYLNQVLELTDISEEEKQKIRDKINTLIKKDAKETADYEIKMLEEGAKGAKGTLEGLAAEIERILNDKRTKAVLSTWSTMFDTVTMYYDMQLEKIDELEKREKEYYDEKIKHIDENVEAGLMSEEEADARKRIIEENQLAREKQLEQQRKEMQRKQAIWNKANSIVQTTIAGAQAVAVALTAGPILGPILAGVVAGMIASQIAMITAQQIPAYAKGTDYHPGGLARVGDGGRSEMVILPSGDIWKTPATDTFVNLPRGSEVLPDYRKAMMAMSSHPYMSYYDDNSGKMILLNDEVLRNNTKEANSELRQLNIGLNTIRQNTLHKGRITNTGNRLGISKFK